MAILELRRRPAARWALIFAAAAAIHAAALLIHLGATCEQAPASPAVKYAVLAPPAEEERAAAEAAPADHRVGGGLLRGLLAEPPQTRGAQAGRSHLAVRSREPLRSEDGAVTAAVRPCPAMEGSDVALSAGALGATGNGGEAEYPARAARSTGGTEARFETAAPAAVQVLRLAGKPIYPRACRQGLCRHGQPCEGSGEWRVYVAAGGGKPVKIECAKRMECELQNDSIRRFFAEARFPRTKEATVYIIPVRMYIGEE